MESELKPEAPVKKPEPPKPDPIRWKAVPPDSLPDMICEKCQSLMFPTLFQGMYYCPKCLCYYVPMARTCPKCGKDHALNESGCQDCAPKAKYRCISHPHGSRACNHEFDGVAEPQSIGMKCVVCPKCGGKVTKVMP